MDTALIVGLYILVVANLVVGVACLFTSYKSQKSWEALIAALRNARRR